MFFLFRPRTDFALFAKLYCRFAQFCKINYTHTTFRTIEALASFAQQNKSYFWVVTFGMARVIFAVLMQMLWYAVRRLVSSFGS